MTKREKELEAIVRELAPAVRDVIWCALVWNDHNFDERAFQEHARAAAKSLGLERTGMGDVEAGNEWMARINAALLQKGNDLER